MLPWPPLLFCIHASRLLTLSNLQTHVLYYQDSAPSRIVAKFLEYLGSRSSKEFFLMSLPQCGGGSTVLHFCLIIDDEPFWPGGINCNAIGFLRYFLPLLYWRENSTIYLLPIDSFVVVFPSSGKAQNKWSLQNRTDHKENRHHPNNRTHRKCTHQQQQQQQQ